jgi:BirA family biotin operon repressor/biotin-[acetyl-CoA-carboxylase] ligase
MFVFNVLDVSTFRFPVQYAEKLLSLKADPRRLWNFTILLKNTKLIPIPLMHTIGEPFIILESTESTNIHAMKLANARLANPGTVFFAKEQYAGKGQRGRHWQSEQGSNIIMSALIEPPTPDPTRPFPLSIATALACHDLFSRFAGDKTCIKWPNDLYWNDRKAGGVLIENIIRGGKWMFSVIGIGLNINQTIFDPSLPNPVSLKLITGRSFEPTDLARSLCTILDDRIRSLKNDGFNALLEEYNDSLYGKNTKMPFETNGNMFDGIIKSVTIDGELEIACPDSRNFRFGEIRFLS